VPGRLSLRRLPPAAAPVAGFLAALALTVAVAADGAQPRHAKRPAAQAPAVVHERPGAPARVALAAVPALPAPLERPRPRPAPRAAPAPVAPAAPAPVPAEPDPELVTSRASTRDEMILPGVGNQRLTARSSRHFNNVTRLSPPATRHANPINRNLISNTHPLALRAQSTCRLVLPRTRIAWMLRTTRLFKRP